MFSLILWMLAQSTLSDVPFPLPNASLVNLHQPDAHVSGLLVVNYTTYGGVGERVLNRGIKKVLADAVEMAEAAIQYGITGRARHETLQYVITFSGDSPDTNATEQALIASERLSQLNASSVMTRVAELWPQLHAEVWHEECDNESSWQDSCSPPNAWALTWMSQPELSLWVSLATLATTESQGCEQRDGFVRVSGGSGVFSVNDIVMNSSVEEIDEWRANMSREMQTWRNALKAAIPTCPHGLDGVQSFKGLYVRGRCWNQSEDNCRGWWRGPKLCRGDSETWSHCQPHNCSLSCEFKLDGQIELCGQSGGEIRDALDSLSDQVQYVQISPSVRSYEIKYCEYENVIEVTPGSNYFGTFAHLCPLEYQRQFFRNIYGVSKTLLQKGLTWQPVEIYNNSGLFNFIRLRAFESALGGQRESWVNFTTFFSNYRYDKFPWWGGDDYHINHPDPLGDPHRIRVQIQWRIKVSSPKSLSTPWIAPKIHLPCLVEFQEHLLKVNFLPNGSGHHHPLRGSRFNAPLGGRAHSRTWPSEEWINFHLSDSLWAQPGNSKYEMTSEDLRAWQVRHNISRRSRPRDYYVLDKIAAGPAPNSLEITFVPPAGGPNTKWRICFIPADGFHIYPEVCTEQFPVRETAEGCNAESSKGVQMTAAACLTSLWFALTWF